MSIAFEILVILLLILVNGMFSMYELAMVSAKRTKLELMKGEGDKQAGKALSLLENPNKFLSTVQIGISLISVLSGAFGGARIAAYLSPWFENLGLNPGAADSVALAVVVLIITFFSIVLGELIPKRIAMNNPELIARNLSGFMAVVSNFTKPLIGLLDWVTNLGIKILGIKEVVESNVTEEEIRLLLAEGRSLGVFKQAEQDYVEGVFRFTERRVDALMTPRIDIEWIDLEDSRERIIDKIRNSNHSQFPIAIGQLDELVGVIDVKDLATLNLNSEEVNLKTLAQLPIIVPENTSALNALERFQKSGIHEAMVIDEYGSVIGMVTLFDILESIVGDIKSDDQVNDPEVVTLTDNSWSLDGMLPIDELKELLEVEELPNEKKAKFQTLSGFVMNQLGEIPKIGQTFEVGDFYFEVTDMDLMRVDRVAVRKMPKQTNLAKENL